MGVRAGVQDTGAIYVARRVARQRNVGQRRGAVLVLETAAKGCKVARQRDVGQRQRAKVVDAPSMTRVPVTSDGDIGHQRSALVVYAATVRRSVVAQRALEQDEPSAG